MCHTTSENCHLCSFTKIVSTTQKHIIVSSHYLQQVLLCKKIYENASKKRPQGPPSKNEVKRIFVQCENTKQKINVHKLLFFISQNGRPDEKEIEPEKTESAIPL